MKNPPVSAAKMKELNLSTAKFPSCAEPDGKRVKGCPEWDNCRLPEKGAGGPVNKGCRMAKINPVTKEGRVGNVCMACYNIPALRKTLEMNGGALTIVANEGENIKLRYSYFTDENIPGQGPTRIVHDGIKDFPVPKYTDANETNLLDAALAKEIIGQNAKEVSEETAQEILSVAAGGHPRAARSRPS